MNRKKSINFLILYFGKFPAYFQLFLNSCSKNPDIDWTVITDNSERYVYPPNVHRKKDTFQNIKRKISDRFDFEICLDDYHKLCEWKPAYGYLFDEYIKGYDFWGYCDIDVIYGNLRKFLTDSILSKYNKIGVLGHLTLIRNKEKFNTMFMKPADGRFLYRKAFSSPENYNFDEEFAGKPNINTIFRQQGETVYRLDGVIADIYTKSAVFRLTREGKTEAVRKAFFLWDHGNLYRYFSKDGSVAKREYMYIHLQKRKMNVRVEKTCMRYKLIPNVFEPAEKERIETIQDLKKIKLWYLNLHYFRIRFYNLKQKAVFHNRLGKQL